MYRLIFRKKLLNCLGNYQLRKISLYSLAKLNFRKFRNLMKGKNKRRVEMGVSMIIINRKNRLIGLIR